VRLLRRLYDVQTARRRGGRASLRVVVHRALRTRERAAPAELGVDVLEWDSVALVLVPGGFCCLASRWCGAREVFVPGASVEVRGKAAAARSSQLA
jgi:hypothetical protein